MSSLAVMALAVAALLLWLIRASIRAAAGRRAAHTGYLSEITRLFDKTDIQLMPSGFPRMTGIKGPHRFDIQVIPDSLTFRKLPALWVMLSLPEPLPVTATLDIMARPTGLEPFSHFANLPHSLPLLDGLPEGTAIRSDAADVPDHHLIAPHFALFDDPKVKEMLIAPKGLRLVILAEEADRGRFLIFRDAEMGMAPLHPSRLSPLIDAIIALRKTLIEAP